MNILIIGNGFDLAHGFPTKYEYFLHYINIYQQYKTFFKSVKSIEEFYINVPVEDKDLIQYFCDLYEQKKDIFVEIEELISDNVWIKYFSVAYQNRTKILKKDGWIDFECEISRVVKIFDKANQTLNMQFETGAERAKMTQEQLNVLSPFVRKNANKLDCEMISFSELSVPEHTKDAVHDLIRLIRCLEIYLCDFVGGFWQESRDVKLLPDIKNLPSIDCVLSFNYTDTYEKLYEQVPHVQFDYIHGKADIENDLDSNNMVLGIDEYLDDERKSVDIEFIEFKKYFQRIHKKTGCQYKIWLDDIEREQDLYKIKYLSNDENENVRYMKEPVSFHNLYIFGHSLDITDKDILRGFILGKKVKTTIFYLDKKDYARKIANLVRIIGQDEVIKRTGGKNKTIEFVEITKEKLL